MALYFWDASDYDWARGPMNLAAAKADGITGFSHKATEATYIKHVHTGEALARARDAGIEFVGGYHVVRSLDPAEQVDFYLSYLDRVASWWRDFPGFFHQVDLELWSYDRVSAATGMSFAAKLKAAQPKWVVTYASRGQYGNSLQGIVTPLWNAAYGYNHAQHYPDWYASFQSVSGTVAGDASSNWAPYSGQVPVFWQYGSQLRIGTQPGADCSAYRGTLEQLRQLITGQEDDVNTMPRIARDTSGQNWIGDGIWRKAITGQQATNWIQGGAHIPYDGDVADIDNYGRDVAEVQTGSTPPTGIAPHTHEGGTSGPVAE